MKGNFPSALASVLKHEGGFVNHPQDPGGMTNLGVTRKVWEEWVGRSVSEKEMRQLTPEKVSLLYRMKYWDRVRGDDLPAGVDYAVFDFAVNSGPGRAAKFLQEVVGVTPDGSIGPVTLRAVAKMPPVEIIKRFNEKRRAFLQSLPTWSTFGRGWGRRVDDVAIASAKMVQGAGDNLA